MPVSKEELQERAQLVRVHEANCKIEHPTPDELNFRRSIMIKIGLGFGLKEVRTLQITGPGRTANPQPATTKRS
jgi:hypothetical protein